MTTILTESDFMKYSGFPKNPLKRLSSTNRAEPGSVEIQYDAGGSKILVYFFPGDGAPLGLVQVLLSLCRFFYGFLYVYPGSGRPRRDQLPAHRLFAVPPPHALDLPIGYVPGHDPVPACAVGVLAVVRIHLPALRSDRLGAGTDRGFSLGGPGCLLYQQFCIE